MVRTRIFIFLFGLAALWACRSGAGEQKNTTPGPGLAAFPDSLLDRFEPEIRGFMAQDSLGGIRTGGIVFTGSSSIRLWSSLTEDMAPLPVLNRGFGGSTLPEVNHFFDQVVLPYQPRVVVLYCGENDLAMDLPAEAVLAAFQDFVARMEADLPQTRLVYLSMKPSTARWALWPEYLRGNRMIRDYAQSRPRITFLDVSPVMLTAEGAPDTTIFIQDGLHMNAGGYRRWTTLVRPVVSSLFGQ